MRPSVAVSGWPVPPQRNWISPAAIETAVSCGVLAPRSSPIRERVRKPARPSRMSSGSKQSASTLHFVADEAGPHKIIAEYRDQLAPGSYLAITHGTLEDDPAGEAAAAERVYRQASSQLHVRPLPDVLRFFEGFELVEPGLTWITEWRPEPGTAPTGRQHSMRGGVGRKP